MKIYSEKTNKEYATVEDCLAAEKEFDEAVAAKEAEQKKALAERKAKQEALVVERKAAADEVEAVRQKLIAAQKEYREVLSKFCDKYGAYHYSIKPGEGFHDFFSSMFDSFWL